jgi:hypothetical protein
MDNTTATRKRDNGHSPQALLGGRRDRSSWQTKRNGRGKFMTSASAYCQLSFSAGWLSLTMWVFETPKIRPKTSSSVTACLVPRALRLYDRIFRPSRLRISSHRAQRVAVLKGRLPITRERRNGLCWHLSAATFRRKFVLLGRQRHTAILAGATRQRRAASFDLCRAVGCARVRQAESRWVCTQQPDNDGTLTDCTISSHVQWENENPKRDMAFLISEQATTAELASHARSQMPETCARPLQVLRRRNVGSTDERAQG